VETVHQQLRQGDAIFETDAREYLLALIGGLQDSAADEDAGRTISIVLPDELQVAPDRLARLGMAVTELVTRALRHGHGGVEVSAWRDGTAVVLSARDEAGSAASSPAASPWAARRPQDALGLRLLSMLAQPGGVSIDPSGPQRITVRLAA
jgi:two-component sensor histidine kinase